MKKILSIDGGGIRGVVPARILSWLETKIGRPSAQTWDLIAGTSTGGILACGLAHTNDGEKPTYSAAQLLGLYVDHGAEIFHREWYQELALLKVRYGAAGIEGVLKKYYGDVKLSSALTPILVTAWDRVKWQPKFFKSRKAKLDPNEDAPLWEASRATSAAPTYFPPFNGLKDGGLIGATNPSVIALTEARATWPGEDILLLSLGTGRKDNSVTHPDPPEWGELSQLKILVDELLDGPELTVERVVNDSLPEDRRFRVQGLLTAGGPSPHMDDASAANIQSLIAFADQIIAQNEDTLQRVVGLVQ